jgi:hypothetical protein
MLASKILLALSWIILIPALAIVMPGCGLMWVANRLYEKSEDIRLARALRMQAAKSARLGSR